MGMMVVVDSPIATSSSSGTSKRTTKSSTQKDPLLPDSVQSYSSSSPSSASPTAVNNTPGKPATSFMASINRALFNWPSISGPASRSMNKFRGLLCIAIELTALMGATAAGVIYQTDA